MLALTLALRNIRSHLRRNAIIFTVTGGVSLFLFLFLSFSDGELENIKNGVSSFWSPWADIKAVPADWEGTDHPLTGVPALADELKTAFPEIQEAVARHWNLYMDLHSQDSRGAARTFNGFSIYSFDPGDATLHSRIAVKVGKDIGPGDRDKILLHSSALENLPLGVGDQVTIVGQDFFGQFASRKVTVAGFFTPLLDNPNLANQALLDQGAFTALAGYSEGEANQLLVRLRPGTDAAGAQKKLQAWADAGHRNLRFYLPSEKEFENGNTMVFGMVRYIIIAMVLLTLLITAFGIMNVVSVNLFDRQKEIGTYFCLGCEKPFLLATYTLEIFLVNLAGAVAGVLAGLGVREAVNALGITTTDPGLQTVFGASRFTLGLSPSTVFWILGGVSLITLITALTTLGKALDVPPVVAVKETE